MGSSRRAVDRFTASADTSGEHRSLGRRSTVSTAGKRTMRLVRWTARLAFWVACTMSAPTAQAQARDAWSTKAALLDVLDHALARHVAGDDFHSLQRRVLGLGFGERPTPQMGYRFFGQPFPLCTDPLDAVRWARLECKAIQVLPATSACGAEPRCLVFRAAPFVLQPETLQAMVRALADPCGAVPDAEAMQTRHGMKKSLGPLSIQAPAGSLFGLYCDTPRPASAHVTRSPDDDSVLVVRWTRRTGVTGFTSN